MSYKLTIFQKFSDGDETRAQTHTEAVDLKEAFNDARIEAMTVRLHANPPKDYTKPPIFERISAYPTLSLRGRNYD